jgi:hypothetical protein
LERNFASWNTNTTVRFLAHGGTSRNQKAIYDLGAAAIQFNADAVEEIARDGYKSPALARLQARISPIDRVNNLLLLANLPVQIAISDGEVKTVRDGNIFSVARMSDGERSALVILSEVVCAKPGRIFIIDEPELHLHRSIVVPLIKTAIRERPGDLFIISTHELALPAEFPEASIALVRGCRWSPNGDVQTWDIDVISDTSAIPEDTRVDILGSRKKILFIEGIRSSLDMPMYSLLFPAISVRSRETCRDVERAVIGLRSTEDVHHAKVFGLIDNDGMSSERAAKLTQSGIYALPVHAVESLYYDPEVIARVAARQAETLGIDPDILLREVVTRGLAALTQLQLSQLAARMAERKLREQILGALPSRDDLTTNQSPTISVSLVSPMQAEQTRIERYHAERDIHAIIRKYPVRESGLLAAIASALHFQGRADYEKAALTRIGLDDGLKEILRGRLGDLATLLQ